MYIRNGRLFSCQAVLSVKSIQLINLKSNIKVFDSTEISFLLFIEVVRKSIVFMYY